MKKLLVLILTVFAMMAATLGLTACNEPDNGDNTPNNVIVEPEKPTATYKVTFDLGYDNLSFTKTTFTSGKVREPEKPERAGYTFTGWTKGGEAWNFSTATTAENITLTANWVKEVYTARFIADGEEVAVLEYGVDTTALTGVPSVPEKVGYTGAWSEYSLGAKNIVVSAVYTPVEYTVTYSNLKGATNVNKGTYNIENDLFLSPVDADGFTFVGWYNADNKKVSYIAKGTTGNVTLTAKWAAHEHNLTFISEREPSCYSVGVIEHYECSDCGHMYLDENAETRVYGVITPETHSYVEYDGQDPTCTEEGWAPYKECQLCGDNDYEIIEALGHKPIHHLASAPTCTEAGWDAYDTCARCDYTSYVEIPALGHKALIEAAANAEITNDANIPFTQTGNIWKSNNHGSNSSSTLTLEALVDLILSIRVKTSSEDGYDKLKIDVNGVNKHEFSGTSSTWYVKEITLNEGDIVTFKYSKDSSLDREEDCAWVEFLNIVGTSEQWVDITPEYIESLENVCATGVYCDVCHEAIIEPGNHSIVEVEAKEPTCTEIGWDAYEYCEFCDYTTYVEIENLGGSHSLTYYGAQAPTCTEVGWDAYEACDNCSYTTKEEIPAAHKHVVENYTAVTTLGASFSVSGNTYTSTNKSHGSSSTLTVTALRDMTLGFYYGVSSESRYDWFTIKHNGVQQARVAGSYTNVSMTLYLNEGDVVTFTYSKDGSGNSGSDCGWVGFATLPSVEITFTPDVIEELENSATEDIYCSECGDLVIDVESGEESFDYPNE